MLIVGSLTLSIILMIPGCGKPNKIDFPAGLKPGDLIFVKAKRGDIWKATGNKYGDIGIVMDHEGSRQILAVAETVQFKAVRDFIAGRGFVVKRMVEYDKYLHPGVLRELGIITQRYLGKPADTRLSWDNDHLYPSELVWKTYLELLMMVKLCEPGTTNDLDWSSSKLNEISNRQFKGQRPPNQSVVLPDAIYNSTLLETVYEK